MKRWFRIFSHKTRDIGQAGELQATNYLLEQGLTLLDTNYRRPFGEIDLIMQDKHILVFVEVRVRSSAKFGGAVSSVVTIKQRRLTLAALSYLKRFAHPPECRFDVVAIDDGELKWIKNGFDSYR